MADRISVVIVDDHELVREGLRSLLSHHDDIEVVAEASSLEDAVATVSEVGPDVVLLDLRLGEAEGGEVARRLRAAGLLVKILVLSVHDTAQHLRDALAAGADGYLLKSVTGPALADGIRNVVGGQTVIGYEFVPKLIADANRSGRAAAELMLTAREHEVLGLIAAGLGNRAIAERLDISVRTAQKHLENLFKKVGVHDRTELVAASFRSGLLG